MALSVIDAPAIVKATNPTIAFTSACEVGDVIAVSVTNLYSVGLYYPATTDNVNSGGYLQLYGYYYAAQNTQVTWQYLQCNAAGTPTVAVNSGGNSCSLAAFLIRGWSGTPTPDTAVNASASNAGSTTVSIPAASNFDNEILLVSEFGSSGIASGPAGYTGTTGDNSGAFYAIEAVPTSNDFSATLSASAWWLASAAALYDAITASSLRLLSATGVGT